MTETLVCDNCRDEIEGELVRRGSRVYCCEACAFEASRSADCGGRAIPISLGQPSNRWRGDRDHVKVHSDSQCSHWTTVQRRTVVRLTTVAVQVSDFGNGL